MFLVSSALYTYIADFLLQWPFKGRGSPLKFSARDNFSLTSPAAHYVYLKGRSFEIFCLRFFHEWGSPKPFMQKTFLLQVPYKCFIFLWSTLIVYYSGRIAKDGLLEDLFTKQKKCNQLLLVPYTMLTQKTYFLKCKNLPLSSLSSSFESNLCNITVHTVQGSCQIDF